MAGIEAQNSTCFHVPNTVESCGAFYALAAGFALLCLALPSLGRSLAALIPLGLSLAWTAGFMALFQIGINVANLVAIPLLIGIAIEYGTVLASRLGTSRSQGGPSPAARPKASPWHV